MTASLGFMLAKDVTAFQPPTGAVTVTVCADCRLGLSIYLVPSIKIACYNEPMKTTVNTEIKMPKKVMEALTLFETYCVILNKRETTIDEVKAFIKKHYNQNLADKFQPEFLY